MGTGDCAPSDDSGLGIHAWVQAETFIQKFGGVVVELSQDIRRAEVLPNASKVPKEGAVCAVKDTVDVPMKINPATFVEK